MASWQPHWALVETHICLSRHIKPSPQRSPDSDSIKCIGCLHNHDHFLAEAEGEYFIIFFLKWKAILSPSSHVFVLWSWEIEPILNTVTSFPTKLETEKQDSGLWRHQMTTLYWKLSENDFAAAVTAPMGDWLNTIFVSSSGLLDSTQSSVKAKISLQSKFLTEY